MDYSSIEFPVKLPLTFIHQPVRDSKNVVIFLHGYTDTAGSFLKRALIGKELGYNILAPNGPFPVPIRVDPGFKDAYAWYFWDYAENRAIIHPDIAVDMVARLVDLQGYASVPKVIVGFSQGGFFAPFLLKKLKNVRGLISIGSGFRTEDFAESIDHPVIGIHGEKDAIVKIDFSKAGLEHIKSRIKSFSEYHTIAGLGHSINEEASALLVSKIHLLLKDNNPK